MSAEGKTEDVDLVGRARTVLFVGDYFSLVTTVEGDSDDAAIAAASAMLLDYYGWDVAAVAHEIGVIEDAP